jgi:putative nucleotidyltransferase with HDIG domain
MVMQVLTSQIRTIAQEVGEIPTLNQVAWKVLQSISDESTTVRDLERLISCDQALTVRILKISNSAFFAIRGTVSTLSRAIVILGLQRLRSLVVAASVEGLCRSKALKDKLIWEHALAVALAASFLARECRYRDAEEAFVCGLLHDLGKAVLDRNMTTRYQAVLDLVYNEEYSFLHAERELLGFDHTEVGCLVAEEWHLPPLVGETIRYHHEPEYARLDPTLCALVSLGDAICIYQGIGPEKQPDMDLVNLEPAKMLNIQPERLLEISEEVKEKFLRDKKVFGLN